MEKENDKKKVDGKKRWEKKKTMAEKKRRDKKESNIDRIRGKDGRQERRKQQMKTTKNTR